MSWLVSALAGDMDPEMIKTQNTTKKYLIEFIEIIIEPLWSFSNIE